MRRPTTLFSYVVKHDTGFAPNPFWGYCTLATCKPKIRRDAVIGDWIVGTGSVKNVGRGRVIYAMRVNDVLSLEDYAADVRFRRKRPKIAGSPRQRVGDNIYVRATDGTVKQLHSRHGPEHIARDLRGKHALISTTFWYWGRDALSLPASLEHIVKKGPGHRSRFDSDIIRGLVAWLKHRPAGLRGQPCETDPSGCDCEG